MIGSRQPSLLARGNVVDLGCGDGNLARTLDRRAIRPAAFRGVDVIEGRVSAARAATPWARFEVNSADDVPVPDGWADAVVAMTLLSSIVEARFRAAVAAEIDRIARPGGRAVIYDIRYPSPSNPNVRPVPEQGLARLFPTWSATYSTFTLLPPIARRWIAASSARYRTLTAIPLLRSHIGAVLTKP